jgi:2,3-bisphosphoglycerate-independent phosphoglycerate mutase
VPFADGDAVVFMNFRADRARQITRAIISEEFDEFERRTVADLSDFVMLTRYADDIDTSCAFDAPVLTNTLGEYVAGRGRTQLRIAETEKYAHVTFFFSGGREDPFDGEKRLLIPSPDVATYDLQPEMSAAKVTDELVKAIRSSEYDLIICNYANGDMVGHTGVFDAAVQAVETLDVCLGRLEAALAEVGGQMLITADHGNVEQMLDHVSEQAHTAHTSEPVPLVYLGPAEVRFTDDGTLADVAPTLLDLMDMDIPQEMTGKSLVTVSAPADLSSSPASA